MEEAWKWWRHREITEGKRSWRRRTKILAIDQLLLWEPTIRSNSSLQIYTMDQLTQSWRRKKIEHLMGLDGPMGQLRVCFKSPNTITYCFKFSNLPTNYFKRYTNLVLILFWSLYFKICSFRLLKFYRAILTLLIFNEIGSITIIIFMSCKIVLKIYSKNANIIFF